MDAHEHRAGRGGECRNRHDSRGMRGARGMSGPRGMHVRRAVPEAPRSVARGGIRFAILDMLTEKARHGYDIIRGMEEASGGLYSPSPGSIYPTLQSLEDQDLVSSTTEEGKKVYAITEAGTAYLEQHKERADSHRERWDAQWGRGEQSGSGETLRDIHDAFHSIKGAIRGSAGDTEKLEAMREVLTEAVAKIEQLDES